MFDIGFSEILIVATLTLIIMGPKRLPETVKTITLWLGRIRNFINSAKVDIENEVGIDEIKKQLHNEKIMNEIEKSKRELNSISKDLSMSQENEKVEVEFEKQPLISHLIELRNRILLTLIVIFAVFLVIIPFSGTLYLYISEPIRVLLADDVTMIATRLRHLF